MTRGDAEFDPATGQFTVWGAGRDIFDLGYVARPDEFHFVWRKARGNARITARVDSLLGADPWAKAGVMIRAGLDGHERHLSATVSFKNPAQLLSRTVDGTGTWTWNVSGIQAPAWLRIERRGNNLNGYFSTDGVAWSLVGTRIISMPDDVWVGLVVASKTPLAPAVARFSEITIDADIDGDGLTDDEEAALGTDPALLDTDGDDVNDWDETRVYHSNPLVPEWRPVVVATVAGTNAVPASGEWNATPDGWQAVSVRGEMAVDLAAPRAGLYEVRIEGSGPKDKARVLNLRVALDGVPLGTKKIIFAANARGSVSFPTPWLRAGPHRITVFLDNAARSFWGFTLNKVDLIDLGSRAAALRVARARNDLFDTAPASLTSPFCAVGTAAFAGLVDVRAGRRRNAADAAAVHPGPDGLWRAEVPLDTNGQPTLIHAVFENGADAESARVKWEETDVLERNGAELVIRKGDALRLAARGKASGNGRSTLRVQPLAPPTGTNAPPQVSASVPPSRAYVHRFDAEGVFTVSGLREFTSQAPGKPAAAPVSGALTVRVVGMDPGPNPAAWAARPRDWQPGPLPDGVSAQFDSRVQRDAMEDASGWRIAVDAPEDRHVWFRLGTNGPVLASTAVEGFDLASANGTWIKIVETVGDTATVQEMGIVMTRVPDDIEIELEIAAGGILFDDGTTRALLHKEDFDELGIGRVRFVIPNNKRTVCHLLRAWQRGVFIGGTRDN